MRRDHLFLGVLVIAVLSIVVMPANAKNVLRWASQGDALTMDPMSSNESTTISANRQVYGTLVAKDQNLKTIPWLATSWKIIDPTTWEFQLRKGVKFHDGTPFTAADVKFSFNRAKAETSDFKGKVKSVKEVKIINDHLVQFITNGPNPILPNYLVTIFMMSEKWCKARGVEVPQNFDAQEETYAVRHAMGTGPFKLVIRDPDVRTMVKKNEDWWGIKEFPTNVDEIVFTPIANQATRVAALLSGEIDFLLDPPLQDLRRLENAAGIKLQKTAQVRTIFYGMNQGRDELLTSDVKGKNPLKDKRVRQAFYQSIDIEAIKKIVMRGYSMPAGIITPPPVNGYTKEMDERLSYDPEAAKRLMAEAGYPDGFSIRLDCPNNRYNNDEAICQATVGMLGKIGVKVKLSAIPKTLHFPKIKKRDTDFYMLGWGVSTLDSHYVFHYLVRGADKGWNGTGFNDPEINDMIIKIGVETDFAKRDAMIQTVWDRVQGDIVYLPLHHQVIAWAMSDKIDLPIFADNGPRFHYARFLK